jgi:hypothetical protein
LTGAARKEWDPRRAGAVFHGRLQEQEALMLEDYCGTHGTVQAAAEELSKATDPREIKVLTSITKQFRKNCATTALHFGFRLDSSGHMNLEKLMSLTAADKI